MVIPVTWQAIISGAVTVFVLTLGPFIVPQVLSHPQHWTLFTLITDQAIFNLNMPFASAVAVVLLVLSASVIALVSSLEGGAIIPALRRIYMALPALYLIGPIIVITVISLNARKFSTFPPRGFSLRMRPSL